MSFYKVFDEDLTEDENELDLFDPENAKGKLYEWINEPRTLKWIQKKFKYFLLNFSRSGRFVYKERISEMCRKNKQSLEINIEDLKISNQTLALWIYYEP